MKFYLKKKKNKMIHVSLILKMFSLESIMIFNYLISKRYLMQ